MLFRSKNVNEDVERTIMSYLPYEGYRGGLRRRRKTKKMSLKRKHRKTRRDVEGLKNRTHP